jgi:hypothetical protein
MPKTLIIILPLNASVAPRLSVFRHPSNSKRARFYNQRGMSRKMLTPRQLPQRPSRFWQRPRGGWSFASPARS